MRASPACPYILECRTAWDAWQAGGPALNLLSHQVRVWCLLEGVTCPVDEAVGCQRPVIEAICEGENVAACSVTRGTSSGLLFAVATDVDHLLAFRRLTLGTPITALRAAGHAENGGAVANSVGDGDDQILVGGHPRVSDRTMQPSPAPGGYRAGSSENPRWRRFRAAGKRDRRGSPGPAYGWVQRSRCRSPRCLRSLP
jgi:hypothetical protein